MDPVDPVDKRSFVLPVEESGHLVVVDARVALCVLLFWTRTVTSDVPYRYSFFRGAFGQFLCVFSIKCSECLCQLRQCFFCFAWGILGLEDLGRRFFKTVESRNTIQ